jgi:YHS domain-containing protein
MAFDTGVFTSSAAPTARIVDPVCGMTVDSISRAPHRSVGGRDYFFCSPACAQRFDGEPDRFQAVAGALDGDRDES